MPVQVIISLFSSANQQEVELPPLHRAIKNKDYELLRSMVSKRGVDLDRVAFSDARSALLYSLAKSDLLAAEILIQHGADVNSSCCGERPLHYCLNSWGKKLEDAKKEKCSEIELRKVEDSYEQIFSLLVRKGAKVSILPLDEVSPLQRSAELGNLWAVDFLLKKGAKPNDLDQNGQSAIHAAAALGRATILERLGVEGIDPKILDVKRTGTEDVKDEVSVISEENEVEEPLTPVHQAIQNIGEIFRNSFSAVYPGMDAAIREIEDYYASLPPLRLAIGENDPKSVQALLELGADPDGNGEFPINDICYDSRVTSSKSDQYDPDLDAEGNKSNQKALDIAEKMLFAGANLNKESDQEVLSEFEQRAFAHLRRHEKCSTWEVLKNEKMIEPLSARLGARMLKARNRGFNSLPRNMISLR